MRLAMICLLLAACEPESVVSDGRRPDAGSASVDAGGTVQVDAGVTAVVDAGVRDAGTPALVTLHVHVVGIGSVSSAALGLRCTGDCDVPVAKGSMVVLSTMVSSSTFSGWSGACTGTGACSLTVAAEANVTATFTPVPVSGTTYYVSNTGNNSSNGTTLATPLKTIVKAVSVAQPGDVIEVRSGTYAETVNISRPGTALAPITLRRYPQDPQRPVIRGTTSGPTIYFRHDLCDDLNVSGNVDCVAMHWSVEGLKIVGSATGQGDGNAIKIDTAKVRLVDNHLCCSVADVVKVVPSANDVELLENEIWQDSSVTTPSGNAQGIDIVGADRTRIAGNFVHDVPDIGMYAKGNARNTVFENNRLVNIGIGHGSHAIMLGQSTDEALLRDGSYESYDGIVRNNVIVNASWGCVATASSSNVRIYNNSCFNTASTGHASIFLSNESEVGQKGERVEIVNNIIYGSANAPMIQVNDDALADTKTLTVDGNLYYQASGSPKFSPDGDAELTFAQWLTAYNTMSGGKSDSSRVIDPLYSTTTGATPLTLQSSSSAIDTGKATPLVTTDFLGVSRPRGAAIDVGAYEN